MTASVVDLDIHRQRRIIEMRTGQLLSYAAVCAQIDEAEIGAAVDRELVAPIESVGYVEFDEEIEDTEPVARRTERAGLWEVVRVVKRRWPL